MTNQFLEAINASDLYAPALTQNGAISNATSGSELLNYFSKAGTYRDRVDKLVSDDINKMWKESPLITMQMIMYLRMITRKPKGMFTSEEVHKGQGVRDEYRKAIAHLAKHHPDELYNNLWLMPVVGCWKDMWHNQLIDVLDQDKVFELVEVGLNDDYNRALLAKYLPKIRSSRNTFNDRHKKLNTWARALCQRLKWTEKAYRKFKASGEAHTFQKQMSQKLWDKIDFKKISGKALFLLSTHKGKDGLTTIERHGLASKYDAWLDTQPTAKFTGYVYELYKQLRTNQYALKPSVKKTLDKQFDGLLELARKNNGGFHENVWCALDTSDSMTCSVNKDTAAIDVCVSLGIYFSSLNTGSFKDHVIMFDDTSRVQKLSGTFTDKCKQVPANAMGSTNFQSVIDEIVRIRKTNPKIAISDYPTTLLVVSDMQFNPTGNEQTNYQAAMKKLNAVGLPNIKIVWWNVNGRYGNDVPSTINDNGTTLISGFDGSIMTLLLGGDSKKIDEETGQVVQLNPYEQMLKALSQEALRQIRI